MQELVSHEISRFRRSTPDVIEAAAAIGHKVTCCYVNEWDAGGGQVGSCDRDTGMRKSGMAGHQGSTADRLFHRSAKEA